MVDTLREILKQEKRSLRYAASDLGALTGYHPYSDIVALVDKYLYQDLALLRDIDAQTLGVSFVSVEEEVELIVSKKLTTKQQALLQSVQQALNVKHQLNSQVKANKLIEHIDQVIKKELQNNADLTKEDKLLLEQELKGRVRKQYGTNCEDDALNRYEEIIGFPVVERNAQLYILEVPMLPANNESSVLSRTTSSSSSSSSATISNTLSSVELDGDSQDIIAPKSISIPHDSTTLQKTLSLKKRNQEADNAVANDKKKQSKHEPAFSVVGRVDGISYQMDMSSEDCTQWKETKVVVEMKNRVRRISQPPPLYEQIQLVAYMIMTDSLHGDLVQSMAIAPPSIPITVTSNSTVEDIKAVKADAVAMKAVEASVEDEHSNHLLSNWKASKKTPTAKKSRTKDEGILAFLASSPSSSLKSQVAKTVIDLSMESDSDVSDEEQADSTETSSEGSSGQEKTSSREEENTEDGPPLVVPSIVISSLVDIEVTIAKEAEAKDDKEATTVLPETSLQSKEEIISNANTTEQHSQKAESSPETFAISRVSLDGSAYQHRHHWDQVIISRLHLFRQAILTLRQQDSLRYQFLLASEEEKLGIISALCPYYQFS